MHNIVYTRLTISKLFSVLHIWLYVFVNSELKLVDDKYLVRDCLGVGEQS